MPVRKNLTEQEPINPENTVHAKCRREFSVFLAEWCDLIDQIDETIELFVEKARTRYKGNNHFLYSKIECVFPSGDKLEISFVRHREDSRMQEIIDMEGLRTFKAENIINTLKVYLEGLQATIK
jgi:hypothetical protein